MGSQDVRIAGYDELRPIGRGGFGVVYQARDGRFARDVAIKVLNGVLNDTMTARFERECHAVGALSGHPHIVVVHASGTTDDGVLFLVMELLSGGSLADRLASAGPQPWPMAAELGVQLGGALETAHRGGVLHRDVKPENVLLSAYRQPKLVDFGIATVLGGFETKSSSISASLAHAAPEILAGKRATAASDVYALGSTLFQVLTGHPAFHDDDDETLYPMLARISSATVPDLRTHGVPDSVASVVERAMAKQPEDRYDTALAFATALQQAAVLAGQVVSGPVVVGHEQAEPPPASTSEPTFVGAVTPALHKPGFVTPPLAMSALAPPPLALPQAVVPAPRGSRRRATLISAVAIGVAAAVGAGVLLIREDSTSPTTTVAAQSSFYRFAQATDSTVRSTRTWALDSSGRVLSNDTVLVNTSASPMRRVAVEIIPKSVAEDVNDVDFATQGFVIVETDPVVSYTLTLAPKREVHLRWSVQLREPIDLTLLKRFAKDQRDAEKAAAPTRARIAETVGLGAAALVPFPNVAAADPGVAKPVPVVTESPATTVSLPPVPEPDTGTVPVTSAPGVDEPNPDPQTTTVAPPPPLPKPGAPSALQAGNVVILARASNNTATRVSVGLSWSAPTSGGAVASYCLRYTTFRFASRNSDPSVEKCSSGTSRRMEIPAVNTGNGWLLWEVKAQNASGPSAWVKGRAIVPSIVGGQAVDGTAKLRASGLQVAFTESAPPTPSDTCKVTAQSPTSGVLSPGSEVRMTYYSC